MTRLLVLLSVSSVCLNGCAGRARLSAACEWPSETAVALILGDTDQYRHLRDDARAAEELAVRYADLVKTFPKAGEHRRLTERCEATLFAAIARAHRVTQEQVDEALARQNDTPRSR